MRAMAKAVAHTVRAAYVACSCLGAVIMVWLHGHGTATLRIPVFVLACVKVGHSSFTFPSALSNSKQNITFATLMCGQQHAVDTSQLLAAITL
jgi:hypothetical protein